MNLSNKIKLGEHQLKCEKCKELMKHGGWDSIDLKIMHDNGHVWPGFAGEPDSGSYGGSDY